MVVGSILVAGATVTGSLFLFQVLVLPLVFKYSKSVQRKMVFSNCINYPRNLDYENPSSCNVVGGRHVDIKYNSVVDGCPIKLGAWHLVPCSMFKEVFVIRDCLKLDTRLHEELKKTKNPVVLYCHGNSNHRASPHRLQMYKVFQQLNFHVITFDYRGYGDSTQIRPTEKGVVEDAVAVYAWLIDSLNSVEKPTVFIWGHSLAEIRRLLDIGLPQVEGELAIIATLGRRVGDRSVVVVILRECCCPILSPLVTSYDTHGTAVAANMTAHLTTLCNDQGRPQLPYPDALVLEAPFNNLMDEIASHPFSKLVSWLPYYKDMFVKPFGESSEYAFNTDEYLCTVPQLPILILHSKGDKIVPYSLACKLYDKVKASRTPSDAPIVFHSFERGQGLGHNNLCDAPDLRDIVGRFLEQVKEPKSKMSQSDN